MIEKSNQKIYPIVGMSIGNSYFKDKTVNRLLKTVVEKFGRAVVLIPDVPAISTYIALGYPENRARRDKAIPKGNALRNLVAKSVQKLGYSNNIVKIIDWQSEVENNPTYQEEYNKIRNLYDSNPEFQKAVNSATREVLHNAQKEIKDIEDAVKIAVHYLLAELAFHEFAPLLLNADKVVGIYHKNWQVYEDYIAGKFNGVVKNNLGFLIIE